MKIGDFFVEIGAKVRELDFLKGQKAINLLGRAARSVAGFIIGSTAATLAYAKVVSKTTEDIYRMQLQTGLSAEQYQRYARALRLIKFPAADRARIESLFPSIDLTGKEVREINVLGEELTTVASNFQNRITKAIVAVSPEIEGLLKAINDDLVNSQGWGIWEESIRIVLRLARALYDVLSAVLRELIDAASTSGGWENLAIAIQHTADAAVSLISGLAGIGRIFAGVNDFFLAVKALPQWIKGVMAALAVAGGTILAVLFPPAAVPVAIILIIDLINGLVNQAGLFQQVFISINSLIKSTGKGISSIVEFLRKKGLAAVRKIQADAKALWEGLKAISSLSFNWLITSASNAARYASEQLDSVRKSIVGTVATITADVKLKATLTWGNIKDKTAEIIDWIKLQWEKFTTWMGEIFSFSIPKPLQDISDFFTGLFKKTPEKKDTGAEARSIGLTSPGTTGIIAGGSSSAKTENTTNYNSAQIEINVNSTEEAARTAAELNQEFPARGGVY